jgi:hypothetical protein
MRRCDTRAMRLQVLPAVEPAVEDALFEALHEAGVPGDEGSRLDPWRRAALDESVDRDDDALDYAFSPRRTRGATRA